MVCVYSKEKIGSTRYLEEKAAYVENMFYLSYPGSKSIPVTYSNKHFLEYVGEKDKRVWT